MLFQETTLFLKKPFVLIQFVDEAHRHGQNTGHGLGMNLLNSTQRTLGPSNHEDAIGPVQIDGDYVGQAQARDLDCRAFVVGGQDQISSIGLILGIANRRRNLAGVDNGDHLGVKRFCNPADTPAQRQLWFGCPRNGSQELREF